jgi:hypothetical protein
MKFTTRFVLCLLLFAGSTFSVTAGDVLRFSSDNRQVHLIELYTSQGCSSCPPADRWLNQFKSDKRLWKRIVPVAFHVDYWDYLGWSDTLASQQYSDRQRQYRNSGNIPAVYTPGFVLNGKEWKGWFSRDPLPFTEAKTGMLSAELNQHKLTVNYSQHQPGMSLHVAILGFDIESDIKDGENAGHRLPYDFVVLAHQSYMASGGQWQLELPPVRDNTAGRYGLALWVTSADNPRPVQATGGWLPQDKLQRL